MKNRFFWLGPLVISFLLYFFWYILEPHACELSEQLGQLGIVFECIVASAFVKYKISFRYKGNYSRQLLILLLVDILAIILINMRFPRQIDIEGALVILIPDFIVILYLLFKVSSQIDKENQ